MSVDVVVCTYNSERYLDQCLNSIEKNVPVKTLHVIDNYSQDRTIEIAKDHNAEIVSFGGSLCDARHFSFNLVATELFVNVDSDVVLCNDWFNKVSSFMKEDVGAVWGIALDQYPLQKAYLTAMWKLRPSSARKITTNLPNMLGRKSVLKDVTFPNNLRFGSVGGEDLHIAAYIKRRGFRHVTVPLISAHYCYPAEIDKKTYWYGSAARISGLRSFRSVFYRFILGLPQGIIASLVSGNSRVLLYWLKYRFQILYGFLHWSKYVTLDRRIEK